MSALGRFRPAVTVRDFFTVATCYADPTAEIGQNRTVNDY
jgi:hypothetical protein